MNRTEQIKTLREFLAANNRPEIEALTSLAYVLEYAGHTLLQSADIIEGEGLDDDEECGAVRAHANEMLTLVEALRGK